MTTSDSNNDTNFTQHQNPSNEAGNTTPVNVGGVPTGAPAALIDEGLLTRMANEFFAEAFRLPGNAGATSNLENLVSPAGLNAATSDGGSIPASNNLPTSDMPVDVVFLDSLSNASVAAISSSNFGNLDKFQKPSEADLRQLPARAAVQTGLPLPIATPLTVQGPNPGDFNLNNFAQTPTFSFLDEIRPLLNVAAISSPPVSADVHSAQSQSLSSLPSSNSLSTDPAFATSFPQIPGTIAHTGQEKNGLYDFQNQLRAMTRIDVIPTLEPAYISQVAGLPGLKLPSTQFDVDTIRRDFPILQERINGLPLVWLDNAATTQKPQSVIDRLSYFYEHENSNVHRAAHELAARSTDAYEKSRESVRRFLNAPSVNEIVFVRGATEAINLVAQTFGRQNIQKDDEIVISWLEHHANIVPWQMLCAEKGARLKVAPVDDSGQILLEQYEKLLSHKTRLVSLTQVSNALGTVTPIKPMIDAAHRYGAKVLIDGAQAVSHMQVDVQDYDCDFYVFSGHKVFGPTGIGVLYGKADLLNTMPPWQVGGNMIKDVTFEKTLYQNAPLRFEAGTGNIADAVGLGAAIEYLERIGMPNVSRHEHELLLYGTDGLKRIPGLHLVGTAAEKAGVLSFVLDGFKTEQVSEALNRQGIAVRGGHHCAQPILRRFGLESTVRPSLALYNTCEEIDALISALWNLVQGRNPNPFR